MSDGSHLIISSRFKVHVHECIMAVFKESENIYSHIWVHIISKCVI
jgi:hypothetical protein